MWAVSDGHPHKHSPRSRLESTLTRQLSSDRLTTATSKEKRENLTQYYIYFINCVSYLRPIHTYTQQEEHGARSTQHGALIISIHTSTYISCVRMIKYIVFNGKVKICSTLDFHPCSVPDHPCFVPRAACSVLCASMNWP